MKKRPEEPNAHDAEQEVIGATLAFPDVIKIILSEKLESFHFYFRSHRIIFDTILQIVSNRQEVAAATVIRELYKQDNIAKIHGAGPGKAELKGEEYVQWLANSTPSHRTVIGSIKLIKFKFHLRISAAQAEAIQAACYQKDANPDQVLSLFSSAMMEIQSKVGDRHSLSKAPQTAAKTFRYFQECLKNKKSIIGVPSGSPLLDYYTKGFQPRRLYFFGARPKDGKTSYMLQMLTKQSIRGIDGRKYNAYIASMETPEEELGMGFLSKLSGIPEDLIITGDINQTQYEAIDKAKALMQAGTFWIDDNSEQTISTLRANCQILQATEGLDIVYVDFIQYMTDPSRRWERRQLEIAFIAKGLQTLAKDLGVPVIAFAQLGRQVEERGKKSDPIATGYRRPYIGDYREAGDIEQAGDFLGFLWRPCIKQPGIIDPVTGHEFEESFTIIERQRKGKSNIDIPNMLDRSIMWLYPKEGDGQQQIPGTAPPENKPFG
jgi:replicative DNA helicase